MQLDTIRRNLSVSEIGKMLGIGEARILNWIRSGSLPAVNLASDETRSPRYAVDAADLEAFLSRRRVTPTA